MSKYIDSDKLITEIERRKKQDITMRERSILIDIETAIDYLQQEQPDVDLEKDGFYSHSIKARVYPCLDKNTVRVESDERLEKNEYLYPGRNVRMVILLDNKDNTLNARKEE